ncbi:MAG: DUF2442 domain-containing protein [Puniceicoccaceae bacterium]
MPSQFLHIEECTHLRDYLLLVRFNNGDICEVDLSSELHGEVFEPLRSPAAFKAFHLSKDTGTVEWDNGADFAPEFLHEIGKAVPRGRTQ